MTQICLCRSLFNDDCFSLIVLLQIIELLADPSTESPVVPAIAQQMINNPQEFYATARKYTTTHAQPKTA